MYNYAALTKTVSCKDSSGTVMTDGEGNILTEEQELKVSNSYKKVIDSVMSGNSGSAKVKNEGKSYYVSYAPIQMKGDSDSWSVITVHRVSDAMGMVVKVVVISFVLAILAICLAILIIAKLAKVLVAPISSLTGVVSSAADGDFSSRADETGENELGTLAKGLNVMIEKISASLSELKMFGAEVVQSSDSLVEIESKTDVVNEALKNIKAGTEKQSHEVNEVVVKASDLEDKFIRSECIQED